MISPDPKEADRAMKNDGGGNSTSSVLPEECQDTHFLGQVDDSQLGSVEKTLAWRGFARVV